MSNMSTIDFLKLVEEECPLAEDSLWDRRIDYFRDQIEKLGWARQGQAFMNALRGTPYYDQLTGSMYDPFYNMRPNAIEKAINFVFDIPTI